MGVFQNNLLAGAAAAASAGGGGFYSHQIEQSARFDSASSSYLSKTFSGNGASGGKKMTFSFWFKRGVTATQQHIFDANASGTEDQLGFYNNEAILWLNNGSSGYFYTNNLFRDFGGWGHFVFAIDTTQSTSTNRVKIYFNGDELTFRTSSYPSQDYQMKFLQANAHNISRRIQGTTNFYDGYLAEFYVIDNQQLDPSSFGETKNGVWIPKDASGLTFNTNGFYLKFENASDLGNDSSGNNNDFTANNMGADHQVLDTPTTGAGS